MSLRHSVEGDIRDGRQSHSRSSPSRWVVQSVRPDCGTDLIPSSSYVLARSFLTGCGRSNWTPPTRLRDRRRRGTTNNKDHRHPGDTNRAAGSGLYARLTSAPSWVPRGMRAKSGNAGLRLHGYTIVASGPLMTSACPSCSVRYGVPSARYRATTCSIAAVSGWSGDR
jgi:hypothetical protein